MDLFGEFGDDTIDEAMIMQWRWPRCLSTGAVLPPKAMAPDTAQQDLRAAR